MAEECIFRLNRNLLYFLPLWIVEITAHVTVCSRPFLRRLPAEKKSEYDMSVRMRQHQHIILQRQRQQLAHQQQLHRQHQLAQVAQVSRSWDAFCSGYNRDAHVTHAEAEKQTETEGDTKPYHVPTVRDIFSAREVLLL